jgi:acyl carrier protein
MIQESKRKSDLLALLLTLTGNKGITPDSALRGDLDFDSMDFVELLSEMEEHFDIDIPDSAEFATNESATVMDILRFLDDHLGPEYPDEHGLLNLTDEQFINRYIPETEEGGGYFRQREWSDSREDLVAAVEKKCCWTAASDDNGDFCIVWGNRTVNRLYNIITSHPIEDEAWEVQVPEEVGPRILCDVDWDTTEGNEDGERPEDPDLPKQVVVRLYNLGMGEMTDDVADTIAITDYLSNEYGFCVNSFTWRALAEGEEVES